MDDWEIEADEEIERLALEKRSVRSGVISFDECQEDDFIGQFDKSFVKKKEGRDEDNQKKRGDTKKVDDSNKWDIDLMTLDNIQSVENCAKVFTLKINRSELKSNAIKDVLAKLLKTIWTKMNVDDLKSYKKRQDEFILDKEKEDYYIEKSEELKNLRLRRFEEVDEDFNLKEKKLVNEIAQNIILLDDLKNDKDDSDEKSVEIDKAQSEIDEKKIALTELSTELEEMRNKLKSELDKKAADLDEELGNIKSNIQRGVIKKRNNEVKESYGNGNDAAGPISDPLLDKCSGFRSGKELGNTASMIIGRIERSQLKSSAWQRFIYLIIHEVFKYLSFNDLKSLKTLCDRCLDSRQTTDTVTHVGKSASNKFVVEGDDGYDDDYNDDYDETEDEELAEYYYN